MSAGTLRLRITVVTERGNVSLLLPTPSTDRVAALIARLVREFDLPGGEIAWQLIYEGRPLPTEATLGAVLPANVDPIPLTLWPADPHLTPRMPAASAPMAPPATRPMPITVVTEVAAPGGATRSEAPAAPAPAEPAIPPLPALRPVDTDDEEEKPRRRPSSLRERLGSTVVEFKKGVKGLEDKASDSPAKERSTTERRATVRYYSRMNPERVFPLLVMLTRNEVEKVVKRHVEQTATGPLTLAADVPLEIEPVLPGCVCHPPMVVTRLGDADEVFTFHVVPHVLGSVTGARVFIRQDHATLAEIKLDIRVVQRTMVVVSGLSALVLPTASAVMNHFGIDFTPKDGTNPYLSAMNFLFRQVTPEIMMGALAALTGLLFWFTRPKGRDVFWDINTKPPGAT